MCFCLYVGEEVYCLLSYIDVICVFVLMSGMYGVHTTYCSDGIK
jgi:hypothetical protein